ncbi:MAG TPA: hypothetical protein VF796_28835 [Humisphaera sp.]
MSQPDPPYRVGFDRMDHPLSHTAAVVGGVAFIFVAGCLALLLSDTGMLRSSNWWGTFVLSAAVLAVSVIGYFRPYSRAIYVPVVLAGLVTLGLCVWHLWLVRDPATKVGPAKALYQSLTFFGAWLAWAARTLRHLRRGRPSR